MLAAKPLHDRVVRRAFGNAGFVECFRRRSAEFAVAREWPVAPTARGEYCVGPASAAELRGDGDDLRVAHQLRLSAFKLRKPASTAVPPPRERIARDRRDWPAKNQLASFGERSAGRDGPSPAAHPQVAVVGAKDFREAGDAGLRLPYPSVQPPCVPLADPLVRLESNEHGASAGQVPGAWAAGFDRRVVLAANKRH